MPEVEKQEEYELIPLSPLRRLEKRIEQLETASPEANVQEIFKEVIDIVRMNQEIVDELAKANDALRIEISKLPSKMDDLINNLNELISFIKASATEEISSNTESFGPIIGKLDELIQTNKKIAESNQVVMSALDEMDKRFRKPVLPPLPPGRKPLLLPPPKVQ
jgi:methyl-accepting chemotaxis protein